jgi:CIC family chloride channel protein
VTPQTTQPTPVPDEPKRPNKETRGPQSLFAVAALSVVVGPFTGGVGALFRVFLHSADGWRTNVIVRAHSWGLPGLLSVVLGIALISSLAAWMVSRFAPGASGSGIPDVECQLRTGRFENPLPIVIVKFIGGLLAIGGGLVLGREGPTVQMGSGIGDLVGRAFQRNENECRLLLAAGAGAGLATAFNAPIAGAIFVLEELTGSFEIAITATTLGASASAICVSRVFLGQSPDFEVPALGFLNFGVFSVSLVIGMLMGLLGVAYNRCILAGLNLSSRFTQFRGALRAAAIGAFVGIVGWFMPLLIGAGDLLTQDILDGKILLGALAYGFLLHFFLGPISYATRAPGGLFAPMLTVGAQAGTLFFMLWGHLFPYLNATSQHFAIIGIAAFFSSVVRAPITGIILAVELTGSFSLFLPMLGATFAAIAMASLLKEPPIYESLSETR